jgi:Flp pilus assembly pilin Flp
MQKLIAFNEFFADQDGASMAEYAVLLAVIIVGTAGAMTNLGGAIINIIGRVTGIMG